MKALKGVAFFLSITTVAAVVVIILMVTGVINLCSNACTTPEPFVVNEAKLKEIKDADYKAIKQIGTHYYSVNLLTNGKVNFDFDREITNVDNAEDIALLNDNLYILTKDGNVYKYFTGITKELTLEATKVDSLKNVTKLVEYTTARKNAGGCNYIIAIDQDNNYTKLEEFCI